MSDIRYLLDRIAANAGVPAPQGVRRRADRRRRRRQGLSALACVAVVVAAVGLHGSVVTGVRRVVGGSGPCASAVIGEAPQHGPSVPAAAMLTNADLGPHWYPGPNPDGGERPIQVTGIGRQLASGDLQARSRATLLLRGGTATSWQLRETVVRYDRQGAAELMDEVRTSPSCDSSLTVSGDRRGAAWETLILRQNVHSELPVFTVVGRIGTYVVLIDINPYGLVPTKDTVGPASWVAWLGAAALGKVAAASGRAGAPVVPVRPTVRVPSTPAPAGFLTAGDVGRGWYVGNTPGDNQSVSAPLWGDCTGPLRRGRLQLYRRDDPRSQTLFEEAIGSARGPITPLLARIATDPCGGWRARPGGLPSLRAAVVLVGDGQTLAVFRSGLDVAAVRVSGLTAGSAQALALLDRAAVQALRNHGP